MASLTTTNNLQLNFDPATVAAVSNQNPNTDAAATCVYGVMPGLLLIKETAQAFLARLQIAAKFAPLTGTDGETVWIRGASVYAIRGPIDGDSVGANAVVYASGLNPSQDVRESVASAIAALNACGADL